MAIVGLIPFVYATIKRKRRSMARAADSYAGLLATGGTVVARGNDYEHARGAYQSQSCHFTVRPSPDDELVFPFDDYGPAPPAKAGDLSRELFPADRCERQLAIAVAPARGRGNARIDGGSYQSQSCRFAVRPLPVDELVVPRDSSAFRRPPAQPEGLSRQLLLPASRQNGLATGAALGRDHEARFNDNQSQSCRFAVHHSPSEDLSGKLLLPADGSERGVSRSMRLGSMRVFAWVSGA